MTQSSLKAPEAIQWNLFAILFVSAMGTGLYMAAVPVFLLKLGMTAGQVATAIALTTLPNMVLGKTMGMFVDRSDKRALFLWVSAYLLMIQLCLVYVAPAFHGNSWIAMGLTIAFAVGFSPLMTLTYQYVIPSLSTDETRVFAIWESMTALSAVISGLVAYFYLQDHAVDNLIIADGVTYLVAGVVVYFNWKPNAADEEEAGTPPEPQASQAESAMAILTKSPLVIGTVLSMWAVAMSVHPVDANATLIGFDALKLDANTAVAFTTLLGLFSAIGGVFAERRSAWLSENLELAQMMCIWAFATYLLTFTLGFSMDLWWVVIACFAASSTLEPIWGVVNTRLLRQHIPRHRFGEVFGLLRMPRAALTMFGMSSLGWAQQAGGLHWFTLGGAAIMLFCMVSFRLNLSKSVAV